MKQITVKIEQCLECPYYEPQPNDEKAELGECLEMEEAVAGTGSPPCHCPYPDV